MKNALPWFAALFWALIATGLPGAAAAQENCPPSAPYGGDLKGAYVQGPVTVEADSLSYDREGDVYRAAGDVHITFSGGDLQADSVSLAKGGNNALAQGRVVIRTGNDVLEGDRVDFNIDSGTGIVYGGRMFMAKNHFYIRGDRIEKTGEADYRIVQASLTACDGERPDWRITGRQLDVTVDGYGAVRDGRFLAGEVPLLYVPYLPFPAKTTRQTGLLFPRLAYSRDKLGWDVELPLFVALSKSADATFYQRYMDKRGFKEGAEFRYALSRDSYGVFYGDYLRDGAVIREEKDGLNRDRQAGRNRWSLYFHNYTLLKPGLYLRADMAKVSDNWYFKDFSSHNYYLDHRAQAGEGRFKTVSFVGDESLGALDSRLRIVKDWSLYNLTALLKYRDDLTSPTNEAVIQKYPEIAFTGARQTLAGGPLNFALAASYSRNYRSAGQEGDLLDIRPVLSLPVNLGGSFQLTPEVEVRESLWRREDDSVADKRGGISTYQAGATLTASVFRDFAASGGRIERLRHEIKPELSWFYAPRSEHADMPDFVPEIEEKNVVTAALTNSLTARLKDKEGKTEYRDVLRFKLAQSYDLKEARRDAAAAGPGNRPFGDIDLELDVTPSPYLAFYARNRYEANSGFWKMTNYDLNLSDGRGDALSLGYRYRQNMLEELNLNLKIALTGALDLSYELKKNEADNRSLKNFLAFSYKRQCWTFGLTYADDYSDRSVMLSFSLWGLGDTGKK